MCPFVKQERGHLRCSGAFEFWTSLMNQLGKLEYPALFSAEIEPCHRRSQARLGGPGHDGKSGCQSRCQRGGWDGNEGTPERTKGAVDGL